MKSIPLLFVVLLVVLRLRGTGSFGNKGGKVVKQDQDGDITDILTSEGEKGWLEKVLKKAKAEHKKKPSSAKNVKGQDKFDDDSPPSDVISSMKSSLDQMESAADDTNKGWATRAKSGLEKLETKWLQTPEARRGEIVGALNTAAGKLEKFANAGEDPVGAIRGAVEIIATFANLAGPHGQIISVALNFISGFLSLFGKGTSPKPVSEVVREEIERWYSRDLTNQAEGAIFAFQRSKAFLNGVAKSGNPLTDSESTSLAAHVPVYEGVAFMGTLATEIRNIIRENEIGEAKRCLKYIELYVRLAILKDVILQQMAALIPDSQNNTRNGVYQFQNSLQTSTKALVGFLYKSEIGSNVVPYFDPDKYELTDAYLTEVLEIESYDRSIAGRYLIEVSVGNRLGRLGYSLPVDQGDGRADIVFKGTFYWKLVPHGNNLFSIVNRHECPNSDLCDALLTWTRVSGRYVVTIEHDDPALWEITRRPDRGYRIRCKWGCNKNPPHEMCNAELSHMIIWVPTYPVPILVPERIVTITMDGGKSWKLSKV